MPIGAAEPSQRLEVMKIINEDSMDIRGRPTLITITDTGQEAGSGSCAYM